MNLKLFIIFFLFPIAISANDWSSSNEWSSGKDWTPINRDKALGLLNSNSPKERREALGRLADVGFFEDTPKMLTSLWDAEYSVRKMAENAIWGLWLRANDPYIDSVFQRAIVEVQGSEYEIALQMFKNVTELKPEFAEGWNKLGDVYFALNDFENAINSFYKTLELNSYQFGTMESLGYLMMELQREKEALKWFNMALDINPNLIHLAEIVNNLKEKFGDKNI